MSAAFAPPPLAPWQQRIYAQACEAMDAGRLPHGLLFVGPAKLGKRVVAERLAARALCLKRGVGEEPCGQCRGCQLYASRSQTDPAETRPDNTLAHPFGHPAHPDALFIGYGWNDKTKKMRGEIVIEQIRDISAKLSLTPQFGTQQVALLEPADAINHAAANALLKTLEEPNDGRFLWLVTSQPARLPATIRSRCQQLVFRVPPHDEALDWLVKQGHAAKQAEAALDVARGHPGLADVWLRDGSLKTREAVIADLGQLARDGANAQTVAQRWTADDTLPLRLQFAAEYALECARAKPEAAGVLAKWFDQANRVREGLRTTVRADLAVLGLLLAWPAQKTSR